LDLVFTHFLRLVLGKIGICPGFIYRAFINVCHFEKHEMVCHHRELSFDLFRELYPLLSTSRHWITHRSAEFLEIMRILCGKV
jgi:hypothetical protein